MKFVSNKEVRVLMLVGIFMTGLSALGMTHLQAKAQVEVPSLILSEPDETNLTYDQEFEIDLLFNTAGKQVEFLDAKIEFDPNLIEVVSINKLDDAVLPLYQSTNSDNVQGKIQISSSLPPPLPPPNPTTTPANGDGIMVAKINFKAKDTAGESRVDFIFDDPPSTPPNTNDSNLISPNIDGNPVDILKKVEGVSIVVGTVAPSPTIEEMFWDLNDSGDVNLFDFSVFINNFSSYAFSMIREMVSEIK